MIASFVVPLRSLYHFVVPLRSLLYGFVVPLRSLYGFVVPLRSLYRLVRRGEKMISAYIYFYVYVDFCFFSDKYIYKYFKKCVLYNETFERNVFLYYIKPYKAFTHKCSF